MNEFYRIEIFLAALFRKNMTKGLQAIANKRKKQFIPSLCG